MKWKHTFLLVGLISIGALGAILLQRKDEPGVLLVDDTHFACTHDHSQESVSDRESALQELAVIDRQLQETPNDPTLISRKVHLGLAADPQAAIDACQSVLRRDPDNRSAMGHLVVAYSLANRHTNALSIAGQMLRLYPDAETHCVTAGVLAGMGKTEQARDHFETALKLDPSFQSAQEGLEKLSESAATEHTEFK